MWIRQSSIITIIISSIFCASINIGYAQDNNCGLEKFQCLNGECIASELLCDGKPHCKDQSDETESVCSRPEIFCPGYAFRCKYGACINGDSVCNGIKDCIDNSDETAARCTTNSTNQTAGPTQCKADQFRCDNGQCIYITDVCDGTANCADNSDETFAKCGSLNCPGTVFRCAYGACIDADLRCNGVMNCIDGSDEDSSLCSGPGWQTPFPTIKPTLSPTPLSSTPFPRPPSPKPTTKFCITPSQPQNGHWKLHRSQCANGQDCDIEEGIELELGSHLVYSCNPGYNIRGSVDVTCSLEGKWLNIPVCTEIRCKPLSTASTIADCTYNNDWVSCGSQVLPGTSARIDCRNSYRRETLLSRQSNHVTCNVNGQWEPEPIRCVPVCGRLPADITPLVVHGRTPNITEFPWHASMYRDYPDEPKKYFCGASIIQENLLITAAHCVYDEDNRRVLNPQKIYIVTGNVFRDYNSPLHDSRIVRKAQVKNIYIVCNFLGLLGNYLWDIAILELIQPFVLSTWLVPVCIDPYTYGDQAVLEEGAYGKVAGFGKTAVGDSSAVLQAINVPFIPFSQCKSASHDAKTEQYITIDKFCAGYTNGSSVCDGDSGSGLIFKTGGLWYLRGIVSVSLGTILEGGTTHCNNNLYTLYTRVSSHIGWIQDVIAKLEQNKQYPLCPNNS